MYGGRCLMYDGRLNVDGRWRGLISDGQWLIAGVDSRLLQHIDHHRDS